MEVNVDTIARIVRVTVEGLKKQTYGYGDLNYALTGSKSTNSVYVRFTTKLPSGEALSHSIRVSDHPKYKDYAHKGKVVILHKNSNVEKLKRSIRNTLEDLYLTRAHIVVGGRQYVHKK